MGKEQGEPENFVLDNTRVLASVGDKACSLGCIYCFVNAEGYQNSGRIDTQAGNQELSYEIEQGNVQVLYPAHDIELFLIKDWDKKLMELTSFGIPINVATKSGLGAKHIEQLKTIDEALKEKGALLHMAVSLTRLHDWKNIETRTPSPERRIATAKSLSEAGLAVTIALRPTLPFVPEKEFEELIARTAPYCESYSTGPLYLTPQMKQYMDEKQPGYQTELVKPSWIKGRPFIEAVNTDTTIALVKAIAQRWDRPVFNSSPKAVEHALALRLPMQKS